MKKASGHRTVGSEMRQMAQAFFAVRSRDGEYRKQLDEAFYALLKKPCAIRLKQFGIRFGVALFGGRLTYAVLSDRAVVRTGVYAAAGNTDADTLYHFAPTDCAEKILSSGLLPKKHYVFLTDRPRWIGETYLPWKTSQLGKPTEYTLLRIDAGKLAGIQKVFRTDREHEFVTGKIDAKFISVARDDPESGI